MFLTTPEALDKFLNQLMIENFCDSEPILRFLRTTGRTGQARLEYLNKF